MGKEDSLDDFQKYDFSADKRFKEYMSRFEVVNAASEGKIRAKFYKANIDPNFDVAWVSEAKLSGTGSRSSNFQSTPPPRTTSSSNANQSQSRAYQSSNSGAGGYASPPSSASKTGARRDLERVFLYHLAVLVLAVVHLVPVIPYSWSRQAYRHLLQISLLGQGYQVYLRHGLPSFRPLTALQAYFTRTVPTNNFYLLILSFSFMSHAPMILVLVPFVISAAYGVAGYIDSNYSRNRLWQQKGRPVYMAMQRRSIQAYTVSAIAEVLVGASLVFNLFSIQRNIMLTIAMWNLLKMRYHVSEASAYHRQVWNIVGARTAGLRSRLPPPISSALDFVKGWWLKTR